MCQFSDGTEPVRSTNIDAFAMIQDGVDAVALPEEITSGKFTERVIERVIRMASSAEEFFELSGYADENIRSELRRRRVLDFLKDDYERISVNEDRLKNSVKIAMERVSQILQNDYLKEESSRNVLQVDNRVNEMVWRGALYKEKHKKAKKQEVTNRITESACLLAETSAATMIITASTTGRTTRMVARMRARVGTIGATHDSINARKLTLSYGVIPIWVGKAEGEGGTEALFRLCKMRILNDEYLSGVLDGKDVILTCGLPVERPGTTNTIQLRKISYKEE
jgi:pyruvate kinase